MSSFRVINVRTDVTLAGKVERADTFISRLVGLWGRRGLGSDEGFHLTPCSAIHTLFLRFPLDVLFLDKENSVVKLFSNLPPNRFAAAVGSSRSVLELAPGRILASKTDVGDPICFHQV
jgi:uncharacterized membrane protein (UPF0127 family)